MSRLPRICMLCQRGGKVIGVRIALMLKFNVVEGEDRSSILGNVDAFMDWHIRV